MMDLTSDFHYFSWLLLLLIPLFIYFIFIKQAKPCAKTQKLPPGPYPWPIIGNIHLMGSKPHISLTSLAQRYGPLISIKLGVQLLIVGSSPSVAKEILKTNDRVLSARYLPKAFVSKYQPYSLIFATECSDNWKSLRALCRNELFSNKAMEMRCLLRERKVAEMVNRVAGMEGREVKIGELVFATLFNILGQMFFSRDLIDEKSDDKPVTGSRLKDIIWEISVLGVAPNMSDFYPAFERFDLQGLNKRFLEAQRQMFENFQTIVAERRKFHDSKEQEDFLDTMFSNGLSDDQIYTLIVELLVAGTETTSTTIEWTMSELIKNKEAMYKVREELRKEVGSTTIEESHMSRLSYLNACVKETLRLHPPAPFLIPHYALETCEVMKYTIPKGSQLLVNIWAIGRDPTIWEDPLSFKPERFLNSNLDFKGQDFEFLPFGSGRRMCPGLPFATNQAHFILASLIHNYEWFLPDNKDPAHLDMSEKLGITLQREQALVLCSKCIL